MCNLVDLYFQYMVCVLHLILLSHQKCFELNDNRIGKSILSQSPLVTFSHVSNYRFGGSGHVTSSGHKYGTILLIAFFFSNALNSLGLCFDYKVFDVLYGYIFVGI